MNTSSDAQRELITDELIIDVITKAGLAEKYGYTYMLKLVLRDIVVLAYHKGRTDGWQDSFKGTMNDLRTKA